MLRDETVLRRLAPGNSVLVGTTDAQGWPASCRGVALTVNEEGDGVTVYVPVTTGAETVANVATRGRVAILSAHPVEPVALQLKGRATAVRLAGEREADCIEEYVARFADILQATGLPRALTLSLSRWPAYAIDVAVHAVFDQTPGPRAGALLLERQDRGEAAPRGRHE